MCLNGNADKKHSEVAVLFERAKRLNESQPCWSGACQDSMRVLTAKEDQALFGWEGPGQVFLHRSPPDLVLSHHVKFRFPRPDIFLDSKDSCA